MQGKIGIITFHRAVNYGAILQTYGLYTALRRLGRDAEVIDYRADFIEKGNRLIFCDGTNLAQRARSLLISILLYRGNRRRLEQSERFINKHLSLSAPVSDLRNISDSYAAYITGSDQVFNRGIVRNDADAYFLSWVADPSKKYSYAASFGATAIEKAQENWYRQRLQSFAGLSIREQSGADLVLEITGRKAEVHMDSTFLLTRKDWASLAEEALSLVPKQPYILLYPMLETERLYQNTQRLSVKMGLPVICLSAALRAKKQYPDFHFIADASPEEFLALFQHAACVMTSSFHGTAFSIQFQKQFISMLPLENGRSDRVRSLLRTLGLQSRLVDSHDEDFDISAAIDWADVERRLAEERERAYQYLREIEAT